MARTRSWKNYLIRSLAFFLKAKRASPEVRRILIVSTTALGDTLWATPAIANLRLAFPHAHLAVLASPVGRTVLEHNPGIDRIFTYPSSFFGCFALLKAIKRERFDTALIFHASQRFALPICALSGIGRILGTAGLHKGLDSLLSEALPARLEHEIERRLRMTEHLGAPSIVKTLCYFVQPEERAAAKQWAGSFPKPLVILHPGSKEPFRRWPLQHFAAIGKALQREGASIVLTGTPAERDLLHQLRDLLPSATIFSSSIRSLGALLEQADLVLSNDTGPFHLACAVDCPAIALFIPTDPRRCGPHLARSATAIAKNPTCTPCIKRKCQDPFCFLQISPEEVLAACRLRLRSPLPSAATLS